LPDLLLAILQSEQLLDLDWHARMLWAASSGVNRLPPRMPRRIRRVASRHLQGNRSRLPGHEGYSPEGDGRRSDALYHRD